MMDSPKKLGYHMPAEYEPHHGTLMIWPTRPGSWPFQGKAAKRSFTQIIETIAEGERVYLLVEQAYLSEAQSYLGDKVVYLDIPTNDAWARDTGPTILVNDKGKKLAVDWAFNAWGGTYDGLYQDYEEDDQVASRFAEALGKPVYDAKPFVLEGGAIHSDGQGTILVTESCLLSPGRNPNLTKEEIENTLLESLGAEKVIWLPYGIYQDETNEHVDNVAAFVGPAELVLAWTDDENDPQYAMSKADLELLEQETDAKGCHFTIHKLPIPAVRQVVTEEDLPGYIYEEGEEERYAGERLAASYVNFYIANKAVLVPQFEDVNDQVALDILSKCFPDRKVVGIPARDILLGGGNIHCITQQIPEQEKKMRNVRVATIQMQCAKDVATNIQTAERLVRQAAEQGAQIILLPELFEHPYFCQERQYDYYQYAQSVAENTAIQHFKVIAKELQVVLPISFYEKDGNVLYNSIAVIDADGEVLGVYRKTHIPDDHYYQEKFYFTPGNTGFKVWNTRYAKIGIGICWDQWFPETARCLALNGAELLFYPTAIGSEPILDTDSCGHWQRTMQGHAAANIVPVIAANRYGLEEVTPSEENGGQSSSLDFYGSSFMTDETGAILERAERQEEAVLLATYDLDKGASERLNWGLFRDRRPEMYRQITD